ncbi:MAG TPA: MotA/TolQ/ExbB proton channel family protein [Thermoanaerobaculia bacterium]|nr:MotA/TolQ/ExbB proton channel family protein [Thermoanaerobaculia bacterium]
MTLSLSSFVLAAVPATRFGIIELFAEAGLVAWIVFGILLGFSVLSWAVMIGKFSHFRKAERQTARFLEVFRRSSRFSEINSVAGQFTASPLVGLFQAGYLEIDSQVKARTQAGTTQSGYRLHSLAGLERSLRRAIGTEILVLSRRSQILATTAAATPFIGLFGTVWGIMIAFGDIGASGTASIVAVAPGIAEALVNTAAGLVAAIPALIGYNLVAGRLRQFRAQLEDFALEFINLAERNFT